MAQELPLWLRLRIGKSLANPMALSPAEMRFDPNAPLEWEELQRYNKQLLESNREQRARKSIEPVRQLFQRPTTKNPFKVSLKVYGGNVVGNWSSFPDRALDARVIRYPIRR